MMQTVQMVLHVPEGLGPHEAARWVREFEQDYATLARQAAVAPAMSVTSGPLSAKAGEHEALVAMMARWDEFNIAGAHHRRMLIGKLQRLGYRLEVPASRNTGMSQRTYLKALRDDGVNAGFMNSSTFTFVKSRSLLPAQSDLVKQVSRYPGVDIDSDAAVDFVARVAEQFANQS